MPMLTTLSDLHQLSVRRMLAEGKDPLTIRAVFHAVPERSREALEAFEYARSFTAAETFVLTDLHQDDKEGRQACRLLRHQAAQQMAAQRARMVEAANHPEAEETSSEAKPAAPSVDGRKKRQLIEGHALTSIIRWCSHDGMDAEEVSRVIVGLTGESPNPGTLLIQMKAGNRGQDIPEVTPDLAKKMRGFA